MINIKVLRITTLKLFQYVLLFTNRKNSTYNELISLHGVESA